MTVRSEDFRAEMRPKEPYRSKRLFFLRMHPLCRPCATQGFTVAAAEIDHIVPVQQAPDRFLDAQLFSSAWIRFRSGALAI